MLISLKTEKKSRFLKILGYVWTGPYKMHLHVINSYLGTPGLTTFLFQEPITSAPVYSYSSLTWLGYTLPKMFVATQLQIIMGFCLCTATPSPHCPQGGGSVWSKIRGEGALRRITKRQTSELPVWRFLLLLLWRYVVTQCSFRTSSTLFFKAAKCF